MSLWSHTLRLSLAAACLLGSFGARAALFEDEEARRAILDLRQRLEAVQRRLGDEGLRAVDALARATEENAQLRRTMQEESGQLSRTMQEQNAQLRRGLLELSNLIEQQRSELARQVGQTEQLARELAETQRRLKDLNGSLTDLSHKSEDVSNGLQERLRRLEPVKVSVDGREFEAEPAEARDFQAALTAMRSGDFNLAQAAFSGFLNRYPTSGYKASAQFWLGNAQYAAGNHREALLSLRAMLSTAADHPRAPEAMLAVANAQLELKEPRSVVRKTLEELLKAHPKSEAAAVARDRLAALKPVKVSVDGRDFEAETAETRDFQAALAAMNAGDFALAQTAFSEFLNRYPSSGYKASAQFWLGSAQHEGRNHREALATLRAMLAAHAEHPRAPDALLAVANAQLELKEPRSAVRKTLEDLIKAYPKSEAAGAAKNRLAKLK